MTSLRHVFLATLLATTLAPMRDASACGAFFAPTPAGTLVGDQNARDRVPFLSVERVLLIWDETTQTEHFIREVRFDRADQTFGFVVPVPSKPTVAKAPKEPFDALGKVAPFAPPPVQIGGLVRTTEGRGVPGAGAAPPPPPPVVVLEKTKIGHFTAFVLEANDTAGFEAWLKKNGFATTPASRAWLDEYVKRKYHYVAFRFDPPAGKGSDAKKMASETIRISFSTPAPFYPYREPEHPSAADDRLLDVWFVSQKRRLPIATVPSKTVERAADGGPGAMEARIPWRAGEEYPVQASPNPGLAAIGRKLVTRNDLAGALGGLAALLPKGDLVVQTFRDTKKERPGYGDLLLVPSERDDGDAWKAARKSLYGVLDPALVGGAP